MRNFVIAFIVFLAFVFVIALALGQDDEVADATNDMEYVDNFLNIEESLEESEALEVVEDELPAEVYEEAAQEKEFITALSYDNTAIEIPQAASVFPEQILVRKGYITSYNKETKCPNWVAWHLTKEHTDGRWRRDGISYIVDKDVKGPRQELEDWYNNKLPVDHGHMCPAGDNKWDKEAMIQTFLLTNMCPQNSALNNGDWRILEERCRGWARHYGDIYIVCGPIFYSSNYITIGGNKVGVPDAFYKVVLCVSKKPKALGFVFPNVDETHRLNHYVRSVDEVEEITGFDFFYNLPDDIENVVESASNLNDW